MCETCSPISSMWPTIASFGPPPVPGTRANDEPRWSDPTSAAKPAHPSRHAFAAAVSCPEGPAAVRRLVSSSGTGIAGEAIDKVALAAVPVYGYLLRMSDESASPGATEALAELA